MQYKSQAGRQMGSMGTYRNGSGSKFAWGKFTAFFKDLSYMTLFSILETQLPQKHHPSRPRISWVISISEDTGRVSHHTQQISPCGLLHVALAGVVSNRGRCLHFILSLLYSVRKLNLTGAGWKNMTQLRIRRHLPIPVLLPPHPTKLSPKLLAWHSCLLHSNAINDDFS